MLIVRQASTSTFQLVALLYLLLALSRSLTPKFDRKKVQSSLLKKSCTDWTFPASVCLLPLLQCFSSHLSGEGLNILGIHQPSLACSVELAPHFCCFLGVSTIAGKKQCCPLVYFETGLSHALLLLLLCLKEAFM